MMHILSIGFTVVCLRSNAVEWSAMRRKVTIGAALKLKRPRGSGCETEQSAVSDAGSAAQHSSQRSDVACGAGHRHGGSHSAWRLQLDGLSHHRSRAGTASEVQ